MKKGSIIVPLAGGLLVTILVWAFSHNPLAILAGVAAYCLLSLYLWWLYRGAQKEAASIDNSYETLRREHLNNIQKLEALLCNIKELRVRENLDHILRTLRNITDFVEKEPSQIKHFRLLIREYTPTLISASTHLTHKLNYGLSDDETKELETFLAFLDGMNGGFRRMFQKTFEKDDTLVDIDMSVTMELLQRSGFGQDADEKLSLGRKEQ